MMNIALIDLNHMTLGIHTNTVPLGIGLIARYLNLRLNGEFDIKMFKDPFKFLHTLRNWKPDVLGIAQYSWNSELNLYMAGLAKELNPDCFVVAGGPNLHLTYKERVNFLKNEDCLDICVSFDGEVPFTEIVKRLISGENADDLKRLPPAGAYSINRTSGKLVESNLPPPRLSSLDEFGSIYADGWFDNFLNDGFNPFLQTHRGCPFKCIYCHTGDMYHSRIIFQSLQNFKKDMEYLGRRFAGQHDVVLYLANTNFGLFKGDFEIASVIREIQDKYDWPKNINVNSGNDPKKLLKLLLILKYKFTPGLSLQTLTPVVLRNIHRKNIRFGDFVAFQKEVTQTINKNTSTELILSLPEETRKSFLETVSRVLNSGVQNIVIYTLMLLNGTLIATEEYAKRYGYLIRYRIVPRCFSEINGTRIFEGEKVVVGTKAMPFEDYMDLRGIALIITVFASSAEMFPIRKFLLGHGLDSAQWIFGIHKRISKNPQLDSIYRIFLQETKDELFTSQEELIDFFSHKKNYDLLCAGKFGDNLLRKYKAILLSTEYAACLELALLELRRIAAKDFSLKILNAILDDLDVFLRSRDIGGVFKESHSGMPSKTVLLQYDIPRWLDNSEDKGFLEDYHGRFRYKVMVSGNARKRLRTYVAMNRDSQLSLQILYRDGLIQDFWPQWQRVQKKRGER